MSGYDADERIHAPARSFLARPPTPAGRRRLLRLITTLPAAPMLVFWPESIAFDGPCGRPGGAESRAERTADGPAPLDRTPVAPARISPARPVAPARISPARPGAHALISPARPVALALISPARPVAPLGADPERLVVQE